MGGGEVWELAQTGGYNRHRCWVPMKGLAHSESRLLPLPWTCLQTPGGLTSHSLCLITRVSGITESEPTNGGTGAVLTVLFLPVEKEILNIQPPPHLGCALQTNTWPAHIPSSRIQKTCPSSLRAFVPHRGAAAEMSCSGLSAGEAGQVPPF